MQLATVTANGTAFRSPREAFACAFRTAETGEAYMASEMMAPAPGTSVDKMKEDISITL